jgi:hypothetical protein
VRLRRTVRNPLSANGNTSMEAGFDDFSRISVGLKPRAIVLDSYGDCSNYESAWTWDIFWLSTSSEMLERPEKAHAMANNDYLEDVHVRMLRVTEDLRAIQQELNCAAMQAPNDPELMERLARLPEIESLEMLKSALDQMRHFLWFYVQVMTTGSEAEEKPERKPKKLQSPEPESMAEKYSSLTEAALLRHFANFKNRKPN